MALAPPQCFLRECKWFRGAIQPIEGDERSDRVVCEAFPHGIPDEIAYGDNLHLQPFPGDRGIRYEPK